MSIEIMRTMAGTTGTTTDRKICGTERGLRKFHPPVCGVNIRL